MRGSAAGSPGREGGGGLWRTRGGGCTHILSHVRDLMMGTVLIRPIHHFRFSLSLLCLEKEEGRRAGEGDRGQEGQSSSRPASSNGSSTDGPSARPSSSCTSWPRGAPSPARLEVRRPCQRCVSLDGWVGTRKGGGVEGSVTRRTAPWPARARRQKPKPGARRRQEGEREVKEERSWSDEDKVRLRGKDDGGSCWWALKGREGGTTR